MIKVKFIFKFSDEEECSFPDEANVTSLEVAEEEIKTLLQEFNKEEKRRYKDAKERIFVRLIDETPKLTHEWEKTQLFSGAVQEYKCKNCGLRIECHIINIPSRYSGECHPERVCVHCNKEFKSVKNFERHYSRFHD